MSGGIAQLVAVGAQDAHLVGSPEVSFFRSTYRRHTNFSQTCERQVIQGNVNNNGMSTVRFERKGDLLNYVYLAPYVVADADTEPVADWTALISKVELLIGGQVVDAQDSTYSTLIAPTLSATSVSKSEFPGGIFTGLNATKFYPLRFSFCENWQSALPLVALQYHDVELRITWGGSASNWGWNVYANFAYLDTDERAALSSGSFDMLVTQVQKSIASKSLVQELNYNHPIKYIAAGSKTAMSILNNANKLKLQINGTDIGDYKFADPNFTSVPLYYHTTNSIEKGELLFFVPFCLDAAKLQPTGSLNFSRLDSARIQSTGHAGAGSGYFDADIYAVNYNVLRVENGMAGLLYSN